VFSVIESLVVLPNEAALVAQALVEPAAFAGLYDHYAARVYTYMRYRVDDALTADDLTAQTFEQALRKLKNYRASESPFSAWLFGIAHHVVSHHYRARRRKQWLSLDMLRHHASDSASPEEQTISTETRQQLVQAVARLRDHERNLIALKFAAGLNNRQIAAITDLSESNVGVMLYRAIKQLRASLIEQEQKHE
jgi:RNA polymerase sigma-70 factor (ECF subfamily)